MWIFGKGRFNSSYPQEGAAVTQAWPDAQFVRTIGLGHCRILRGPEVIARVAAFITA